MKIIQHTISCLTTLIERIFTTLLLALILSITSSLFSIAQAEDWIYTTRPGDTLWDISKQYLKSANYWSRLQKHNNVDVAKNLSPGTKLSIPVSWLKGYASSANILSVSGPVYFRISGSTTLIELADKKTLNIGDTLVTGSNGSALVQFADGSNLLVQKNSEVLFNTLSSFGDTGMVDTQLRLQQGRVETRVKPLSNPESRYEITTPAAVAAVRGTEFRVSFMTGQKTMSSEVIKGKINVAAQSVEQPVNAGFGTVTEQGKPPLPPVKLLVQPQLAGSTDKIRYFPYAFKWPAIDGAVKYRVQISMATESGTPAIDIIVNDPQYILNSLDDGQYHITVRGIDSIALEGLSSRHKFDLNTHFPVAQLSSPKTGAEISGHPVTFNWIAAHGAASYRLQISKTNDFNSMIIDKDLKTTEYNLDKSLAAGQYFWRVAAFNAEGEHNNYSTTGQFSIIESTNDIWLLFLYLLPAFVL